MMGACSVARIVGSLKNHGINEPTIVSAIPSGRLTPRPVGGIYARRFALISHRFAPISLRARVGWVPCSLGRDDKSWNLLAECGTDSFGRTLDTASLALDPAARDPNIRCARLRN